jgi:hypothetical protein
MQKRKPYSGSIPLLSTADKTALLKVMANQFDPKDQEEVEVNGTEEVIEETAGEEGASDETE